MRVRRPSEHFGGSTRAQDGCIVTFELPDGTRHIQRFTQIVRSKYNGRWASRTEKRDGISTIEQAAEVADLAGAKIVCISTPQTILTDMQGIRTQRGKTTQEPKLPEQLMLSRIGRLDLLKEPSGGHNKQNIRQVTSRRPSRRGRTDQ